MSCAIRHTARPTLLGLITLACIGLGASALAQVGPAGDAARTDDPFGLTPVDQGTADLGDLNYSNRLIPIDLRQPRDFTGLYEAPDGSGRYMRVSGGISALFPRSEYFEGPGYLFPLIPAGTEFFIGPIPITEPAYTGPGESEEDSRLDLMASGRMSGQTFGQMSNRLQPGDPPLFRQIHATSHPGVTLLELLARREREADARVSAPKSVWSDEGYRRVRLASLLERARASEPGM